MPTKLLTCIGLFVLGTSLIGQSHAQSVREPNEVASRFSADIEAFIGEIDATTEDYAIRINRCEGQLGEFSDHMYYVWVGWRGIVFEETAGRQLVSLLSRWTASGWEITRDRNLNNGGVNVAAIEPVTRNSYSLDSGFEMGPDRYIVGYFSTPCFSSAPSPAPFGPWQRS